MSETQNLRRWLRRDPQPVAVRCDEEGTIITVVRTSRSCWADVESAIEAAGPRVIHALDKNDKVLRSLVIGTDETAENAAALAVQVRTDKERELVLLATLLERAGDNGARRATEGLAAAVNALVQVVQICVDRVAHVESQLAQVQEDGGKGELGQLATVAGAFIQGKAAAAANGSPRAE